MKAYLYEVPNVKAFHDLWEQTKAKLEQDKSEDAGLITVVES